ncbi:ROK family protein [Actibacterium sp. MT2.3-13A]|uniref:glucokinase n=1 Tax=Actibacterium sp. MT2.3-13A TaxID=2828332 RepID=UPI001BA7A30A|nr:ROK family protein [Actibacterium sp. MT2.3-13A]
MPAAAPLSLVADIGATNTRIALARGRSLLSGALRRYRNADHASLQDILRTFLEDTGARPAAACLALAGPVHDGVGHMTNIDWNIDLPTLKRATGVARAGLLNDLQAHGYALAALPGGALRQIRPGQPAAEGATRLVIGIGTGFNSATVYTGPGGRYATASETGHVSLPCFSAADLDMARQISGGTRHATVEDALSGPGLERLHGWLTTHAGTPHAASAPEIMAGATAGEPAARETLRLFVRILGTVAGDLALATLPFGGIYLAGAVGRAVAPHLAGYGFAEAFADKGRFADLMAAFPILVIEEDAAALTGCAAYLAETG